MTAQGPNQVDHQVRTEEVFLKRQANFQANVTYYGRTPLFTTLDSQTKWQIWRVIYSVGKWETTYANLGKYNCVWDDRATYFDAPPPAEDPPGANVSGSFVPSGLRVAGRHSQVTIDDVSWTPLPAAPLAGRNALSIQNNSGFELKINYLPAVLTVGYLGIKMAADFERQYDVKDTIEVFARAAAGAGSVILDIEELS